MKTEHEVLVAARNLIDREGWVQKDFEGIGGGYCIGGACNKVTSGSAFNSSTALDIHNLIAMRLERLSGARGVASWNDAPGRTKQEALDLFDRAIAETAPEPHVDLEVPELVA